MTLTGALLGVIGFVIYMFVVSIICRVVGFSSSQDGDMR